MKKIIITRVLFLISVFALFTLFSCEQKEVNGGTQVETDEYYVKYEVYCNYPFRIGALSATTDQGMFYDENIRKERWTATYGPVKKGFKAEVTTTAHSNVEIHISKNSGPFALKKSSEISSGGSRKTVSYTIDF